MRGTIADREGGGRQEKPKNATGERYRVVEPNPSLALQAPTELVVLDGVRQELVSVDSWKSGRSLPTAASWISAKSG